MALGREQPLPEDFLTASAPTLIAEPLDEGAKVSDGDKGTTGDGPFLRNFVNDLPTGTGTGPEADIWPVYNEHAERFDKEMLETYNGGMDNLLIFVRSILPCSTSC